MFRRLVIPVLILLASCRGKETHDVEVARVRRGTFTEVLSEQGTVKALNSLSVSAPVISYLYGTLKIAKIVDDGREVSAGDTVIIFDPSEIKRAIVQAEQQLEIAQAEYDKMKSTQQSEIEDLQSDLELARISQEISRINFETSTYEPEATRKEIKLKLESAGIALNRAQEQIDNKRIIHREDLLQKELTIRQLTARLRDANLSMNNLFVVSPANGIAIKEENWSTDAKWAVGDSPYSGSRLIELPDLAKMTAVVNINETDVSKVMPGQRVEIRPDAYSDSVFTGKVESVANLAQTKDYRSKIKIFPVRISIDGHSRTLLPGLTVSCRIIVSEIPDVLYIPLESLFREQGIDYVYVKSGTGFRRRDIKTGSMNTDFAIVEEGLEENDEIALSNPFMDKNNKEGENGKERS